MPQQIADIIYKRDIFLKKIIEDSGSCEESLRLLRFLTWENPDVTSIVLNEIITLVNSLKAKLLPIKRISFSLSI
jgi:ubiquitin carboxyl-terminal hydrolase 9/24